MAWYCQSQICVLHLQFCCKCDKILLVYFSYTQTHTQTHVDVKYREEIILLLLECLLCYTLSIVRYRLSTNTKQRCERILTRGKILILKSFYLKLLSRLFFFIIYTSSFVVNHDYLAYFHIFIYFA